MNAITFIKRLAGKRRGDLCGYKIITIHNGKRREITVLARDGRDAIDRAAHKLGDLAPKVAA
jgi:hypothetical protein